MMRDLSMHVMDIVQNSIVAGARNITVDITENTKDDIFKIVITDDGCGMTEETLSRIRSPFSTSRTTRKVGLGIPMLEQTCLQCGGSLHIESIVDEGTIITATMSHANIDRPPTGDITDVMHMLIVTNTDLDFVYCHSYNGNKFQISTQEIKEVLGGVPLHEPEVMQWIKENIEEGLLEIKQ